MQQKTMPRKKKATKKKYTKRPRHSQSTSNERPVRSTKLQIRHLIRLTLQRRAGESRPRFNSCKAAAAHPRKRSPSALPLGHYRGAGAASPLFSRLTTDWDCKSRFRRWILLRSSPSLDRCNYRMRVCSASLLNFFVLE